LDEMGDADCRAGEEEPGAEGHPERPGGGGGCWFGIHAREG
jgi:hypothetical protein